jgi:putative oxidoreductase
MLPKFLDDQKERVYGLLRILAGLMFAMHGTQKVIGFPPGGMESVASEAWLMGLVDLLAGLLIMIGLFTPYMAFLAGVLSMVAYCRYHWQFQFDRYAFPAMNGGEMTLLYALLFLYISCKGGGLWSVDSKMKKGD